MLSMLLSYPLDVPAAPIAAETARLRRRTRFPAPSAPAPPPPGHPGSRFGFDLPRSGKPNRQGRPSKQ
ncbi:hypothetical protein GCM10018791_08260 [Streptomyces zaomyceticus]|nr:hypothetical protein GCM10018791_08260 [Streptomyces zaomyceticus]